MGDDKRTPRHTESTKKEYHGKKKDKTKKSQIRQEAKRAGQNDKKTALYTFFDDGALF